MLSADWHIGKNTVDEDDLFCVLYYMMEQAIEHKCTHFDILGDLLENRSLMMFRLWPRVQKFFNDLVDTGMQVTIMSGNHDQYFTDSRYPSNLRSVKINDQVRIIDTIMTDDDGITWVPWLFEGEDIPPGGDTIFAHLPLNGFKLNNWRLEENGMDIPIDGVPIFTGHFHNPQVKGDIRYIGSPIHHTWNDANDNKYAYIVGANFQVERSVLLNDTFTNLVKVSYDDLEDLVLPNTSKVTVTDVPVGSEELVIQAMTTKGACSVECTNAEEEPGDEDDQDAAVSCMTVDEAIGLQIDGHDMSIELTELHQEVSV